MDFVSKRGEESHTHTHTQTAEKHTGGLVFAVKRNITEQNIMFAIT